MRFNWYKSGFSLLMLTSVTLIISGFQGCKKDPKTNDGPFVRLQENESVQSNIFKREINYDVLLPENYNITTDSFPVVYLLHGYGDDQSSWSKFGLIKYYSDLGATENGPMIFVMPQGFNSYYVNRYNGSVPYMDFFTTEFVPHIDSVYRTIKDKEHRAVMGYSMGGYGALIMPAKNPEIFKTGVLLSMSFRTDSQYFAEPQWVFDSQWGPIFGGVGAQGTARLTDYFKSYSPFYFFEQQFYPPLTGLNFYIDCGDDEETLSETSGELHNLLRDLDFPHEYRMNNGGHSWEYWHKELPEALRYIGYAFRQMPYPADPEPVDMGTPVPSERIKSLQLQGNGAAYSVVVPGSYSGGMASYPLIIVIHQRRLDNQVEESKQLFALLNKNMDANKIPESVVLEIPLIMNQVNHDTLQQILDQVRAEYRILEGPDHAILAGNQEGGAVASGLAYGFSGTFNACLLFDAPLSEQPLLIDPGMVYYLDICDKGIYYKGYHSFYKYFRDHQVSHEYRVRQGTPSHDSFLHGLEEASGFISDHLK
jgi:enterochelin esterase-like enzyme